MLFVLSLSFPWLPTSMGSFFLTRHCLSSIFQGACNCLYWCLFQHVRCKNAGGADASVQLPQSIFLSSWAVQEAEAHVEECRGRRPSQQKADVVQALRAHDSVESGLQVPASVLDECEKSFSAANENQSKAASNIFSDTGLMALICQHDHPLFIVNMTTAGEKTTLCNSSPPGTLLRTPWLVANGDSLWHWLPITLQHN